MTCQADVIVVGAGPAGAALAIGLARRGREVLLLDQAAFPRDKACGEFYSPGVAAALARLGLLDTILAQEHRRHAGMTIVRGEDRFALRYAPPRRGLSIRRRLLDQLLVDEAAASGAVVRQRARVSGVLWEDGRATGVRLRGGEELRASFVAGADGHHSTVGRALGLERPPRWPRRLGLIAHFRLNPGALPAAEMHVAGRFYCGLNPVGEGLVNVGLVGPLGTRRRGETAAQHLERLLDALPTARERLAGAVWDGTVRGIGPLAHHARRVAGPGYLLLGDAAEFFDPFTGEGLFRALRGAELAAAAIEDALGRADRLPGGYVEARGSAFRAKQRLCVVIQLLLRSPRTLGYALRRLEARPELAACLAGALGDYLPPEPMLAPGSLLALLKP